MRPETGQRLNVRVYTAHDSVSVFRIDEAKIARALARYPDVAPYVNVTLTRTQSRYGGTPGWSADDMARFLEEMKDADVLVGYMFPLELFRDAAPNLCWIHIIGAGIEHLLPLDWLPESVILTNNRGAHAPKTYEFAMAAILMLGNHIPRLATAQKNAKWDGHFVTIVAGQTALVVGAGKQGSAVARAAKTLGLSVIGVDPDTHGRADFDEVVSPERLSDVLPRADFVFLTLPYTKSVHHFFGSEQFAQMKETAGFVNIARGKLVDHEALLNALESGRISGAVLDALEEEPLPADSPLWNAPNLIITPHMGCDDEVNYIDRTFDIVMENIKRLRNGEPLENAVDPKQGY
jgi:phosphoglycerate dehydrogenase-like enzyme